MMAMASGGVVHVQLLQWRRRSEDPTLKLREATESDAKRVKRIDRPNLLRGNHHHHLKRIVPRLSLIDLQLNL